MSCTVKDVSRIMDSIAPISTSEEWDNTGLLIGHTDSIIKKILVCLDVVDRTIDEADKINADMIITHHPVIFSGVKKITGSTLTGSMIARLIKSNYSVYTAHTNLDKAIDGTDDTLAKALGLMDIRSLTDESGFGKIGILEKELDFDKFNHHVKKSLDVESIDVIGKCRKTIQTVALCAGAGADFVEYAIKANADVYVTGEIKYHKAQEVVALGMPVIAVGHYESERIIIPILARRLQKMLNDLQYNVEVVESKYDINPFNRY